VREAFVSRVRTYVPSSLSFFLSGDDGAINYVVTALFSLYDGRLVEEERAGFAASAAKWHTWPELKAKFTQLAERISPDRRQRC